MSDNSKEGILGRWSRLKRQSAAGSQASGTASVDGTAELAATDHAAESATAGDTLDHNDSKRVAEPSTELPSIDELDPDSDFAAFMDPGVDDDVRRAALKTLFRDPEFNLTDGLDVYAEDYTKLEKLTPAMVAALRYAQRTLFGKDDEREVERGQASDAPTELASNDADNEQLKDNSETESEQPLPETLHTQSNKN